MNLFPTELNRRLANALRYSVAADRFYIAGRASFWRFVAFGLIAFGAGAAVCVGFLGYAYVRRSSDNLDNLSLAFSRALSEVRLQAMAQGTVQLEPRELALAKGQTISIDSSSRLLLDPRAKVLAGGEIKIQAPPISVAQQAPTPQSTSRIPTITNFTVFKSIPFVKGRVETGWNFLASTQKLPTNQYCYYTEDLDTPGRDFTIEIGLDERPVTPKTLPRDFDIVAAFAKCVWFASEKP